MAKVFIGATGCKMYLGASKIKKAYLGSQRVYSAGNIVTYKVDSGVTYQEEVDSDASCLTPKTFTPAKSGWVFAGWREDATAAGSVLASKVMGDDPITLYAIFKQTVTLTFYNGTTTPTVTGRTRYYNNGNIANPSVVMTQTPISGWTVRGWSTGTAGNAGVTYADGAAVALTGNLTLYGLYYQTITLTLVTPSGITYPGGTRYYNSSGNFVNPTFAPVVPAVSGWTTWGWNTSTAGNAGALYASGAAFALTAPLTLYALYYQTITLTTVANGAATANSGTRYYNSSGNIINPSFTVANPAKSGATFLGWSADGTATVTNGSISGLVLDTSTTRYAVFKYADATVSLVQYVANDSNNGDGDYSYNVKPATLSGAIDTTMYSGLSFTIRSGVGKAYWEDQIWNTYLNCAGRSTLIMQSWVDNGTEQCPDTNHLSNKTMTLQFGEPSGITYLTISVTGGGLGYCFIYFEREGAPVGTLTGRTVVG